MSGAVLSLLIAAGLIVLGCAAGALGHWLENRRRWRRNLRALRELGDWRKELPEAEAGRRMLRRLLMSKPRMDAKGTE